MENVELVRRRSPKQMKKSLSHRLSDDIRRDIMAGIFKPGVRLKTEELANRYAVSANPVREALWRLQGEGFVVQLPNQGARVRVVDEDFVRNIFEIRESIEPLFVRRMCERASEADIARLSEAHINFAEKAANSDGDFQTMDALNRDFHAIITEHEPNIEAIQAIERYGNLINAVRATLAMTRGRMMARAAEHEAILTAIRSGDADRAVEAAARHVRLAGEDFVNQMRLARVRGQS